MSRFQSSPALPSGCSLKIRAVFRDHLQQVSILTRSSKRVQRDLQMVLSKALEFQSSPALPSGCSLLMSLVFVNDYLVSILTRSSKRVQPPSCRAGRDASSCFNPHPLFQAGAAGVPGGVKRPGTCFNPHPLFQAGAATRYFHYPFTCSSFNPHPLFQAGAAGSTRASVSPLTVFQSSPALPSGCSVFAAQLGVVSLGVSILTRSSKRVQLQDCMLFHVKAGVVSILTRSSKRVQLPAHNHCIGGRFVVSILTRSSKRVQQPDVVTHLPPVGVFQSSPALPSGCSADQKT